MIRKSRNTFGKTQSLQKIMTARNGQYFWYLLLVQCSFFNQFNLIKNFKKMDIFYDTKVNKTPWNNTKTLKNNDSQKWIVLLIPSIQAISQIWCILFLKGNMWLISPKRPRASQPGSDTYQKSIFLIRCTTCW